MGKVKRKLHRKHLKEIPLRPYPGMVFVTQNAKAFERACRELLGEEEHLTHQAGRFRQGPSWYHPHVAIVYWTTPETLAHELAHVVFGVFDTIGADPAEGREEPFCYLLSQLFLESA